MLIPIMHILLTCTTLVVVIIITSLFSSNGPQPLSICPYASTDASHQRHLYFHTEPSMIRLAFYPLFANICFVIWVALQAYAKRPSAPKDYDPTTGFSFKPIISALLIIPILYQGGVQCGTTLFLNYLLFIAVDIIWIVYANAKRKQTRAYIVLIIFSLFKIIFVAMEVTRIDKPSILVYAYIGTDAITGIIHFGIQMVLGSMARSDDTAPDSPSPHTLMIHDIVDTCSILWFIALTILSLWASCTPLHLVYAQPTTPPPL